jgi:hypothetical protein
MHHADPEARWALWRKARQAGVLSPNNIRAEENWPPSTDPSANSIAPPNTSAQAIADRPADGGGKIVDIGERRADD